MVVGCILTQNTNWGNVERAISNLKAADCLSPPRLLELPIERLTELIRPAGFFTQKPARLRRATGWWVRRVGEGVSGGPTMKEGEELVIREELLAINGVGPETADAILLYAFGIPLFVVDGYTRRILSRVGMVAPDIRYHDLQALFHQNLLPDVPLFNDFHAQLVQLAKTFCRTTPNCPDCPLRTACAVGGKS